MAPEDQDKQNSTSFYSGTGGTIRYDHPSYVERAADRQLATGLLRGDFCYVLTSSQMGKSSLLGRIAHLLHSKGVQTVPIDLAAIGFNVTPEQWYDGLITRVGRKLGLEDEIDDYWTANARLSPVQRFFNTIREIVLAEVKSQVILFVDEIDLVRSVPFSTLEFFAAIRECYNRRIEDPEFSRLTFALFGAAAPVDLIRDAHTTPFNIGTRIELTDFTEREAEGLAEGLRGGGNKFDAKRLLHRVLHWTSGHPYLTQRLCQSIVESFVAGSQPGAPGVIQAANAEELVDQLCTELFLSHGAREQDNNLLYVRERVLRADADLASLLGLYERVFNAREVKDSEADLLIGHLKLAGIVRVASGGRLAVRNRIYQRVFDSEWISQHMPDAVLARNDGDRISIRGTISIGRGPANTMVLADDKVSRRHALVQAQGQNEFWLVDLGSINGTFLNGRRVSQPSLLHDQDRIDIGPYRLTFSQTRGRSGPAKAELNDDRTIRDLRASNCWLLIAVVGASTQIVAPEPGKDYPMVTGAWIAECKKIIDECGGTIRKFLDDGFFACWLRREKVVVARAVLALRQLQMKAMPSFTLVLHHGLMFTPPDSTSAQDNLDERLMDYVFKMEDLAGFLGESRLMSESAHDQLRHEIDTEAAGHHTLKGFEGQSLFFRF